MRKRSIGRSTLPTFSLGLATLGLALGGGLVGGCSSATSSQGVNGPPGSQAAAAAPLGCQAKVASSLQPVGDAHQGSTVALGAFKEGPLAGKTLAFVADEDAHSVIVVDVDKRTEIASYPLGAAPSQLLIMSDGRLAVGLRSASKLTILHPQNDGTIAAGCAVDTDAEPVALASTPDDKTLLLTTGWGHSLQTFDTASMAQKARVDLPREPRSVVVDDDGKFAYVAHAVGGKLSAIDLKAMRSSDTRILANPQMMAQEEAQQTFTLTSAVAGALGGKPEMETPGRFGTRVGCQGFPITKSVAPRGRILAPQVLVDPGDPENRAQGYGDANNPTEVTNVTVIDAGTQRIVPASLNQQNNQDRFFGRDPNEPQVGECILPRAATVDAKSQTLLVTCLGIDSLVAYDATSAAPSTVEKARWDVGSGPTGVAVDSGHQRAVVWSQFERSIDVIDLSKVESPGSGDSHAKPDRIALKPIPNAMPLAVVLGRQIFHSVGDSRVSKDGRACASCHPDGRDDSITWATPDGPRRTIMLAGRLQGTEPFAWGGTSKDVRDHLHHTFERLNGQGLRNVELEALVAYVESLPPPPRTANEDQALVAKGQAIFNSKDAECSTCHAEGGTDKRNHDIHSRATADKKPLFDTPSLRFVGGRAPYFHDGRFETLRDLLLKTDGTMGHTKQLKPGEVDALEAYLRTL